MSGAAKEPLFAATRSENAKYRKYAHSFKANPDVIFKPIVIETFGALNEKAIKFVKHIARDVVDRTITADEIFQLSVSLYRSNALMIRKRLLF